MSDYIDRKAVGEQFHKLIVAFYSAYAKDGKDERLAALLEFSLAARSVINAIPSADVIEVRHGRWIEQSPDFDLCGVAYYKCSECGKEQQLNSHYCQFCGARMDGDRE